MGERLGFSGLRRDVPRFGVDKIKKPNKPVHRTLAKEAWCSDAFTLRLSSRDGASQTHPLMNKVTPFLSFEGQAEEAVRFYVSLLPDSRIDRVLHSPVDTPGASAGSVLLVEFTLAGSPYIALNASGSLSPKRSRS